MSFDWTINIPTIVSFVAAVYTLGTFTASFKASVKAIEKLTLEVEKLKENTTRLMERNGML